MAINLYDILGIPPFATSAEVRRAYKLKALETHPDKTFNASAKDKAAAEARFHNISQAFDVLSNPTSRQAYDFSLTTVESRAALLAEQRERRQREREEWANRLKEEHLQRMRASQVRRASEEEKVRQTSHGRSRTNSEDRGWTSPPLTPLTPEAKAFSDDLLKEFNMLNPEWETRMMQARQIRASRTPGNQPRSP